MLYFTFPFKYQNQLTTNSKKAVMFSGVIYWNQIISDNWQIISDNVDDLCSIIREQCCFFLTEITTFRRSNSSSCTYLHMLRWNVGKIEKDWNFFFFFDGQCLIFCNWFTICNNSQVFLYIKVILYIITDKHFYTARATG